MLINAPFGCALNTYQCQGPLGPMLISSLGFLQWATPNPSPSPTYPNPNLSHNANQTLHTMDLNTCITNINRVGVF